MKPRNARTSHCDCSNSSARCARATVAHLGQALTLTLTLTPTLTQAGTDLKSGSSSLSHRALIGHPGVGWCVQMTVLAASALYGAVLYINLTLRMPATFVIYDSLFAEARFLLTAKRPDGLTSPSPCGADVPDVSWDPDAPPSPRWALADDARGLHSLLNSIDRLERLANVGALYHWLVSLGLLLFALGVVQEMGAINIRMRFIQVRA